MDKATEEKRNLNTDESKQFDELRARAETLDTDISRLKPLAAKAATIEGTNPCLAIVDEYHLHPDNSVYSVPELGMDARPEGILFAITTAGRCDETGRLRA
ncbi:terminase large subunit domain-containing protein [Erwinia tracheiphila]|uniref:terminase large subunit domain-containing protein n=1 Tax=Erwinia tracheiphila TaxID=65700 RepID=UPI0026A502E9